jgi:hypothetical protein
MMNLLIKYPSLESVEFVIDKQIDVVLDSKVNPEIVDKVKSRLSSILLALSSNAGECFLQIDVNELITDIYNYETYKLQD